MARVSYAIREDPSSVFLLEDAGRYYKDYCQIAVLGRSLIKPEYCGQYLCFAPYFGHNGKYRGDPSKIKMAIEDRDQNPAYDYVAAIDSQVEFSVTPSVISRLSKEHMPAWGIKSYLDYFSDQKNGVIVFLRVYKIDRQIDLECVKKGSKSPFQIFRLYDQGNDELSLQVEILNPVVSDNKFSYVRDEIIHILKTENAFIASYDNSRQGLKDLSERVFVENLVQPSRQRLDADGDFDMAQLDYEAIYREVLKIDPGMEAIIEYIRQIQPARIGEYDYLLQDLHEHNQDAEETKLRLFDMVVRSAVNLSLRFYKQYGLRLDDSFQCACIGILLAIQKHNEGVYGLFPSYASMWMRQILGRDMPIFQYIFRLPVHFKDQIEQLVRSIRKQYGKIRISDMSFEEVYSLLEQFTDLSERKKRFVSGVLASPISIEEVADMPEEILFSSDDVLDAVETEAYIVPIRECMEELKDRERAILEMRYGFGGMPEMSLEDVGKAFGLTRERIRQIQAKAEKNLVKIMLSKGLISADQYKMWQDTLSERKYVSGKHHKKHTRRTKAELLAEKAQNAESELSQAFET